MKTGPPTVERLTRQRCRTTIAWLVLGCCLATSGCVQRRLTIQSNPPGALVRIDDTEIGTTPVSSGFVYYGTRKIQLIKPGYETLTVLQPVRAPWYQWPGIDFFSEHFVPGKIRDYRSLSYNMQPAQQIPNDQLLQRAEQLRGDGNLPTPPAYGPETLPPPGGAFAPQDPTLPPSQDNRLPF